MSDFGFSAHQPNAEEREEAQMTKMTNFYGWISKEECRLSINQKQVVKKTTVARLASTLFGGKD